MSYMVIAKVIQSTFIDEPPTREHDPVGVYSIRYMPSPITRESMDRLMVSICNQIKLRYEGFEKLTPTKMAKQLDVSIFCQGKGTWPQHVGRIYRRQGMWCW